MLPQYMALLLPISLFLSILMVYGRLFSDNEINNHDGTVALAGSNSYAAHYLQH